MGWPFYCPHLTMHKVQWSNAAVQGKRSWSTEMDGKWIDFFGIITLGYMGYLAKISKKLEYLFESWKSGICKVLHVSKVFKLNFQYIGHSSFFCLKIWDLSHQLHIVRPVVPCRPCRRSRARSALLGPRQQIRSGKKTIDQSHPWDPKMWTEHLGILYGCWCNGAITILKNITVL